MKKNSYNFDITKQTLTITASFADAMNDYTSDEYKLVLKLTHDFPNLRIVPKTHRTPTHYNNSDGTKTLRNKHLRLTYKFMESYISALPNNSEEYLKAFYDIRKKAEAMCLSPYSVVSEWFMCQFPKYRSNAIIYFDKVPPIINISDILANKKSPTTKDGEEEKGA